jgi:endoglucanase Acf2
MLVENMSQLPVLCMKSMTIFLSANKARIYTIVRDVGNMSYKDRSFPVVRHKDPYTWFSWATGVSPGTRQEESSSEVRHITALEDGQTENDLSMVNYDTSRLEYALTYLKLALNLMVSQFPK